MATARTSRVAAQLYTLRDHLKTPADIAKTFARLRRIGYTLVQVSGLPPMDGKEIRSRLDEAGLRAIGAHVGIEGLRADFARQVQFLHDIGSAYVAIPWLPAEERKTAADWKRLAKEMTRFGKALRQEGIILQYHNHDFEFQRFGGRTGLEILYAESDPRYLQAEIDTCWVARGGADPAWWCARLKGRLDQVHLKDTVMLEGQGAVFAEVGEGNLNWPAILKACRASGTKHYIVEQDSCPITKDPFKSLAISLRNLRKMGIQ
ncbi:MAG: sugar phosphate isomerase/epimerase [Planctomycetota bacterium]|nr:sugar phosphate isomerase/epimerase [Planctomycetota bacterium]